MRLSAVMGAGAAVVAVAACARVAPAPPPRSIDTRAAAGSRAAARSCPAVVGQARTAGRRVRFESAVGHAHIDDLTRMGSAPAQPEPVRGMSWLVGTADNGDPALLHLDAGGGVAAFPLPFPPEAAALAGDQVWAIGGARRGGPATIVSIDVSAPDAPVAGPVVPLPELPSRQAIVVFAVGGGHLLIGSTSLLLPSPRVVLSRWNAATGERGSSEFLPPALIADAWCVDEGCVAVVLADRQAYPLAFPATGGTVRRAAVTAEGAAMVAALPTRTGALIVSARHGERQLFARPVDALGESMGPPVTFPLALQPDRLVAVRRSSGGMLAIRSWAQPPATPSWWLANVDAGGRGMAPLRPLPLGANGALSAAETDDGTLFVELQSDTDYSCSDDGTCVHTWHGNLSATFADGAGVTPAVQIASDVGGGLGGFTGLPLVRGLRAAVALGGPDGAGRLAEVRVPCASGRDMPQPRPSEVSDGASGRDPLPRARPLSPPPPPP